MYLVDFVLNGPPDVVLILPTPTLNLVGLFLMNIVPFAMLHFLDYRKTGWRVGGLSRNLLQKAIMRKFLNYDEDTRQDLEQGEIVMAVMKDSVDLVHQGYFSVLKILRAAGQLLVVFMYF